MKITKRLKEKIAARIFEARLKEKIAEAKAQQCAFADAAYFAAYAAFLDMTKGLPDEWFSFSHYIVISSPTKHMQNRRVSFTNGFDSYSGKEVRRVPRKEAPITLRSQELVDWYCRLEDEWDALQKQREELSHALNRIVDYCATVEQMRKLIPEVDEALDAVIAEDLNTLKGILK